MKRLLAAAFGAALIAASCGLAGEARPGGPRRPRRGPTSRWPRRIALAGGASVGRAVASHAPLGTVRLALDWTPNTNHTGFFVAAAKGWYGDAGVDFQVLPYGTTAPEALVAAGQAECGISFQDALTFAAAAGAPIVSVMAILQHTAQEIAVLGTSTIKRPRDLDGRTYAGFGYPNEEPTLRAVIKADGGKGTFKTVTLDTAAYDALYAKRADFVIMFTAWEGIEAKERGIDLRTFAFDDYGFPDFYQVVLACDRRWLAAKPELARAFLAATVRGFELAADRSGRRRRPAGRPEPGRLRRQPGAAASTASASSPTAAARRRERPGRAADPGQVAGLFRIPVRPGSPDRSRRQAAEDRPRLRVAVHERLPAVTEGGGRLGRWGPPILLVGAIVLAWEGYVRLASLDPITLPAPSRVLSALWDFRDAAIGNLVPTLVEALVGCALSVTLAIAAAVALDRWAPVRRAVEPLLVTSQTIPIVAIAPLFVIWFGFGLLPKVLIVVLVTFFPVTIALLDGFGRVDPEAMTLMRSMGATARQTFRKLRWPSALPSLFTGLRISAVYAVIGAIFGEYVGATDGLGIWMRLSQNSFRTDLVFGAILLTAIVSVALYLGSGSSSGPSCPGRRARAGAGVDAVAGRPRWTHGCAPTWRSRVAPPRHRPGDRPARRPADRSSRRDGWGAARSTR